MPLFTARKLCMFLLALVAANSTLLPVFAIPAKVDHMQASVAKALLEKVPRCKGDDDRRNMILGAILATDSKFDEALPLFTKVKRPEEAVNCELYMAAKAFALAQNYPKAIEIATIAIDRNSDQKSLEVRASCYSTLGRLNEAIQDYETLARTKPLWASDYLAKEASMFTRMNKHNEALVAAERAVKADPADSGAQMIKGACLEQLGRYGEAVQALTLARSLAKKTISTKAESTFFLIRALEKRAICYKKMGKINESERDKLELKSYSDKLMDDLVGK